MKISVKTSRDGGVEVARRCVCHEDQREDDIETKESKSLGAACTKKISVKTISRRRSRSRSALRAQEDQREDDIETKESKSLGAACPRRSA